MAESPVAVVTGAAGGIGGAVVTTLLAAGWSVVGVDLAEGRHEDLSEAPSGAASVDLPGYAARNSGHRALRWVRGDVSDKDVMARAITTAGSLGPVRGLVTSTFAEARRPLEELDRDTVVRVLDDQVASAWAWGDAVATSAADGGAAIVHISSVHAERAAAGMAAYAMSKAALGALTRAMALEWGPRGVRCNAVLPGFVPVARNAERWSEPEAQDRLLAHHPLARFVRPEDVAAAVSFLLSPGAAGITGVALPVDGGMLCALPDWA